MKTLLSWSSGKDSAWTLLELRRNPAIEVVGLVTTLNGVSDRVAMHGVRRSVLEAQAKSIGLPLHTIELPWPCSNEDYGRIMTAFLQNQRRQSVEVMAFGDLFLQDIRKYREAKMRGTGITPVFPLWQKSTHSLASEMLAAGLKAYVATVDTSKLPRATAGRVFDRALLDELGENVDPCGENGEFHTCVVDGPMLERPLNIRVGDKIDRDGFSYADLMLVA